MAEKLSLQDELRHEGYWWLPEKPDERIAGTLTFCQAEGPELRLLGMFGGLLGLNRPAGEEIVIHGLTMKGKTITLLGAMWLQRQLNSPGMLNTTYRADFLCVGVHFLSEDDPIFLRSYLRFERLEEWLKANPFEQVWTHEPTKLALRVNKTFSEELARFESHIIGKTSDLTTAPERLTQFSVIVQSYLYIESEEARSLQWHLAAATLLQGLASLCTGHYLPQTHFSVAVASGPGDRSKQVEIFWQLQHPEAGQRPKNEPPLFSASELLAANPRAIEFWFDQHKDLSPAVDLFFVITGEKQMFVNVRFLLAIQALEVFHRRTSPGGLLPSAEFKALRKRLIEALPTDIASEMTDKLKGLYGFANEPSLMQRLTAIISEVNSDFGETVPGFSGKFASSVRDTRNYNTHFTAALERKSLDAGGMHWACRRLILLLTYLFLKKIGVGARDFREGLGSHREFQGLFSNADEPL